MPKSKKATHVGSRGETKHGRLESATAGKQTSVITIEGGNTGLVPRGYRHSRLRSVGEIEPGTSCRRTATSIALDFQLSIIKNLL